jgi:predicted transcriptional regulator
MAAKKKGNKQSEFDKMVKELGLTKSEIADMLGLTKELRGKGQGKYSSMNKGGMAKMAKKKKMAGGGMAKMAKKKMRGGGMMKRKMAGGGMAKMAKKKMMRGGMAKKKK